MNKNLVHFLIKSTVFIVLTAIIFLVLGTLITDRTENSFPFIPRSTPTPTPTLILNQNINRDKQKAQEAIKKCGGRNKTEETCLEWSKQDSDKCIATETAFRCKDYLEEIPVHRMTTGKIYPTPGLPSNWSRPGKAGN